MARERYIPRDNQWQTYPNADWEAFVEAVESDVGETVPLSIQPGGKIILDTNDLPANVTENDVKKAIKENHPYR